MATISVVSRPVEAPLPHPPTLTPARQREVPAMTPSHVRGELPSCGDASPVSPSLGVLQGLALLDETRGVPDEVSVMSSLTCSSSTTIGPAAGASRDPAARNGDVRVDIADSGRAALDLITTMDQRCDRHRHQMQDDGLALLA